MPLKVITHKSVHHLSFLSFLLLCLIQNVSRHLSASLKISHLCTTLGVLSILFTCPSDLALFFMYWVFVINQATLPLGLLTLATVSSVHAANLHFCQAPVFFQPIHVSWNLYKKQQINDDILTLPLTDSMQKNRFLEERIGFGKSHQTDQMGLFHWNLSCFQ